MRNPTVWRVAVASLDGKTVSQHFGRAETFYIIDIGEDGTCTPVELRKVTPLCNHGEHTEQELQNSVSALSDCVAVLVSRIGGGAKRALELNHISVFEETDYIPNVLNKLYRYYKRTRVTPSDALL